MRLDPLESDAPVIVYIDFKSPYAYLAVEPTRELERELGLAFDWRPFVLDIPSYLGSARLDKGGAVVEQNRSAEQWSGVKYAYYDCRRYARLRGLTIRGTEKIWNTHLIAAAMLWARQQGADALHAFIDTVYPPFWRRELDVESEQTVAGVLEEIGLDGAQFSRWVQTEGLSANEQLQHEAFAAGVYGVPTYVVGGERYFGREHLPRVRWHLTGEASAAPDVAYTLPAQIPGPPALPAHVTIGVDNSLDSLLALPRLVAILRQSSCTVSWVRVRSRKPPTPPPADDQSRSAMHKRWRADNQAACIRRYGPPDVDPANYAAEIDRILDRCGISLAEEGPERVIQPAMPGIVILAEEELFIGRQHLPLFAYHLGIE